MERVAVQSTEIAIVGYDRAKRMLEVAFRNGSVYHYKDVPAEVYQEFLEAPSIGTYFGEKIRTIYSFSKIH